jgi:stage II sporulation protein M
LSVFPTLRQLRVPSLIVLIAIAGLFIGGFVVAQTRTDLQIPAGIGATRAELINNFQLAYELGSGPLGIRFVFIQNIRVLLAGAILAVFTFGVMGIFLTALPFGILGFLLGQPVMATIGLGTFIAALAPHSLFEMPAAVLAAAAATRLGAIITRPPEGQGVWNAWIGALADVVKIFVGLVVPLLIIAAIIEVHITPLLVLAVLGK